MKNTRQVLTTYEMIGSLAGVLRHNSVSFNASRRENVAEHSYALAVLAGAIAADFNQEGELLDIGKIVQFAVVHDLVEAYMEEGDISVYAPKVLLDAKAISEKSALTKIRAKTAHSWLADTIEEYEARESPEARFVYALDKLVVHMNVILSDAHHARPSFAAYVRTEKIARDKINASYSKLLPYFDDLCEMFRDRPYFFDDNNGG